MSISPLISPSPVATERRSAPRIPAGRRVVHVRGATREAGKGLIALDVSPGGCLVSGAGRAPTVGLDVDVDLAPGPLTPPVRLRARIIHSRVSAFGRFELGVRFTPRSPAERDVVLGWLAELG